MSEPEPLPPLHRFFEELEAEFESGLRREAEQETVAALRAQAGETLMWEALARRVGAEVVVRIGARLLRGSLVASYPDFFVVRSAARAQHLIRLSPMTSVGLPAERSPLRTVPATPRYRFPLALRELARRREPARFELLDGTSTGGTIEQVASDHVELAEHDPGEPRREGALLGRRLLPLAAIVAVTLLPPGSR